MGADRRQKRYGDKEFYKFFSVNLRGKITVDNMLFCPFSLLLLPTETAVNIGYSCKLLDPDSRLLEWQELRFGLIHMI